MKELVALLVVVAVAVVVVYRPEAKFGLFYVDRDDDYFNLRRKITKGTEAYKLIIKESIKRNRGGGAVTDSAISKAEHRFGAFSPDGSYISIPE